MEKQLIRYIVKRSYVTSRTGTEAFVNLIKKENIRSKSHNNENIDIEYTKYNIDKNNKICYTENSFREGCVIPKNPKEE